jgi:hypothetical protein
MLTDHPHLKVLAAAVGLPDWYPAWEYTPEEGHTWRLYSDDRSKFATFGFHEGSDHRLIGLENAVKSSNPELAGFAITCMAFGIERFAFTKAQVLDALTAFKRSGRNFDISFLATCRPDIELADALWRRKDFEVTDKTRWPEGWTVAEWPEGYVDPSTQPEARFPQGTRVFYIPAIETWFAAYKDEDTFVYLLEWSGFLTDRDLFAMYLHPAIVANPEKRLRELRHEPLPAGVVEDVLDDLLDDLPAESATELLIELGREAMARLEQPEAVKHKKAILVLVHDCASDLLYYDREEATIYPRTGDIDDAIRQGEITVDEIVEQFRTSLVEGLKL